MSDIPCIDCITLGVCVKQPLNEVIMKCDPVSEYIMVNIVSKKTKKKKIFDYQEVYVDFVRLIEIKDFLKMERDDE